MLASILGRLSPAGRPSPVSLSRGDVERLHEARRILFEHIEEPPGINELAQRVGINQMKLKRGFRAVFGCTVFEALRAHRMHHARALLMDSDMTVGLVAATVGYTNMSHFIAAFRTHFGVTPGSLLHQSRRCLTNHG